MDFIITWVDGNDPEWQKEYLLYKRKDDPAAHPARFRDWENLKYWFRGVEKFAPWIEKVHFVTRGHRPEWLNIDHPKLLIVNHTDYIPQEYLPTFNSHVIGNNMHRIKDLAEEFVYFNADVFLLRPISRNFFFENGNPCDTAALGIISSWHFNTILLRCVYEINRHFGLKSTVHQNPLKWFHPKYGKTALKNFLLYLVSGSRFPGFDHFHLALPVRKSTLAKVWAEAPEVMEESCEPRFRNNYTVNLSFQRYWELAQNSFHPVNKRNWGRNFEFREANIGEAVDFILRQKMPMVCLNDHPQIKDFENTKTQVNGALEKIFPNKCSFEL